MKIQWYNNNAGIAAKNRQIEKIPVKIEKKKNRSRINENNQKKKRLIRKKTCFFFLLFILLFKI